MRTSHLACMALFSCFFVWFACAALLPVRKNESALSLSVNQIANIIISAIAAAMCSVARPTPEYQDKMRHYWHHPT